MKKDTLAYAEREVFAGIDVHFRQYTVTCRSGREIVKVATMPANPEGLVNFLKHQFSDAAIHTAYEAGFSGFKLHRVLSEAGIDNKVVHAASIEVSRKKSKTDKRDSKKIAEQLEAGRLVGIRVPTEAEENERLFTRTREQLVRERTRIKNQVRMKFHQYGVLDFDKKRVMSRLLVRETLAKKSVPQELLSVVTSLVIVWQSVEEEILVLNKRVKEHGDQNPLDEVYRKLPGIGWLSARILAVELGDLSQFSNEKKLFSFTGLTPSEDTSDESRHLGHITRQGPSRLRHILVQIAWRAIRKDERLKATFEQIAQRAGKKRAIVGIARRLLGHARVLFRKKEGYRHVLKKAA